MVTAAETKYKATSTYYQPHKPKIAPIVVEETLDDTECTFNNLTSQSPRQIELLVLRSTDRVLDFQQRRISK